MSKALNPETEYYQMSIKDRIFRDLTLGSLVIFSIMAFLANLSFHSTDPSFNVATSLEVKNWLGGMGAGFADISNQFFGISSIPIFIFIGIACVFGLIKGPFGIERAKLRLFLGLLGFVFLCMCLSSMPVSNNWPMAVGLGGLLGDFTLGAFTFAFQHAPIAKLIFGILAFLAMLVCAFFVFNLKNNDIESVFDTLGYYYASFRVMLDNLGKPKSKQKMAQKPLPVKREAKPQTKPIIKPLIKATPKINIGNIQVETPKAKERPKNIRELQQSLPLDINGFQLPSIEILARPTARNQKHDESALKHNASILMSVLTQYKVDGHIINVRPGPVVTLYELEPEAGIKSSRVIGLADDIARSMAALSCRVAVVKGRNAIGIELPNQHREAVFLRSLLSSRAYENPEISLPMALGETIGGEPTIVDLAKMPHLLIAGTTGSGKSVGINAMILSLLYKLTPDQCRFIMIDPKVVELSIYNDIPHLLTPVVTDPKKAVCALKWAVREMENRYQLLAKLGVRNIAGYNEKVIEANKKGQLFEFREKTGWDSDTGEIIYETIKIEPKAMPFIVVVIDEMADLMMVAGKEIEGLVQRLAQMARAVGIHLIMATQRPSVDVITGTIKANFPTRISYMVTSKIDSRTILGESGADQLLGNGDLLFMTNGGKISRQHGPFVSDDEVRQIVAALKAQGSPQYFEDITSNIEDDNDDGKMNSPFGANSGDELFDKAVEIVATTRKVSTSFIQRQLKLGYNRAADLVDRMEREGMISQPDHVGRRQVLLPEHKDY